MEFKIELHSFKMKANLGDHLKINGLLLKVGGIKKISLSVFH